MQLEHSFTVPVGVEAAWAVLLDIEAIAPCMPGAAIDSVDGDDFTGTVKVKLGPIGLTYKGKASFTEKDPVTHKAVINAQGRDSRGAGTAAAKVTATLTSEGDESTKVLVTTDLDITGKPAQFGRGVMVDVGNKLIGQFADCLAGKLSGGELAPLAAAAGAPAASAQAPAAAPSDESGAAVESEATKAAAKKAPAKKAPAKKVAAAASGTTATAAVNGASEPAVEDAATVPAAAEAAAPAAAAKPAPRPAPREVEPIDLMQSAGPAVAKRVAPLVGGVLLLLIVLRWIRRR